MIWTVCKISFQRLANNRQELALALALPMLFFTIFALIFSRGVGQSLSQVHVAFVDDDRTTESLALIRQACQHAEICPIARIARTAEAWPIDRLSRALISQRHAEVVVYIPAGFTTQNPDAPTLSIQLYNEGVNPIGPRLVEASLAESIAMELSKANLEAIRPQQPAVSLASATSPTSPTPPLGRQPLKSPKEGGSTESPGSQNREQTVFESIDAFATNKHQPKIALYAAGIAVMFLLFSANGAGASLLEEREAGTLGRLLSSQLTLNQLLLGKWLFIASLGIVQLVLMFVWGQVAFQVDLVGHLAGFSVMTLATASACASFGLFLSALCRSRQQLHGVSVVLVLTMSAVGGSMVPRYIMSDTMKGLGKFTFNGWALDGFQKVFWYDLPLSAIRMEVAVLLGMSLVFGLAARALSERWRLA